jgi:hypothetical protein
MQQHVRGGFVLTDAVVFTALGDGYILGLGTIECQGPIIVEIEKILAIVNGKGPMVQTIAYSYNASLQGVGNILRYDSPHPTHNQCHHVHRFNLLDGDATGRVENIGDDAWPTIGDLIFELGDWYYQNYDGIQARLAQQ